MKEMKQNKCVLFIALVFFISYVSACYSKACPKNFRQAYVSREEYKCVAPQDKYGKCPTGSVFDKVFGCRYDSTLKGSKGSKHEYNSQMFGHRRGNQNNKGSSNKGSISQGSRGGGFYSGGGGRGGGGGGGGKG